MDARRTICACIQSPTLVMFFPHRDIADFFKAVRPCRTAICVTFELHCRVFLDFPEACDRKTVYACRVGRKMCVLYPHNSVLDNSSSRLSWKARRERNSENGQVNIDGLFDSRKLPMLLYLHFYNSLYVTPPPQRRLPETFRE